MTLEPEKLERSYHVEVKEPRELVPKKLKGAGIEKLRDPSCFSLPCTIEQFLFTQGVINSKSDVNVIYKAISKKIGMTDYEESKISQLMVDQSTSKPIGMLRNVPLKVKNHVVPTDFLVLDTEGNPPDLIIRGRPFLDKTDATVHMKRGTVDLHLGPFRKKHTLSQFKDKPPLTKCANKISKLEYIRKTTDLSDCVGQNHSCNGKSIGLVEGKKCSDPSNGKPRKGKQSEVCNDSSNSKTSDSKENAISRIWLLEEEDKPREVTTTKIDRKTTTITLWDAPAAPTYRHMVRPCGSTLDRDNSVIGEHDLGLKKPPDL